MLVSCYCAYRHFQLKSQSRQRKLFYHQCQQAMNIAHTLPGSNQGIEDMMSGIVSRYLIQAY